MTKRVLVVEDDLLNRMFLCATLQAQGFQVQEVSDGAHVMDATKSFDPDLITMDINLPNISGLNLIKKLQADPALKQIPILAITAYVGKGEEMRVRRAGAKDYLAKPLSIKPFLETVDRILENDSSQ